MPFTDCAIPRRFYHRTWADLKPGDLIAADLPFRLHNKD